MSRIIQFIPLILLLIPIYACTKASSSDEARIAVSRKLFLKAKSASSDEKAIRWLEEALRMDSLCAEAYYELANRYLSLSEDMNALLTLTRAARSGVTEPYLFFQIGRMYYDLRNYPEAAQWLLRIPEKDSLYIPSTLLLAQTYYHLDDLASVSDRLQRIPEGHPLMMQAETQWLLWRLKEAGYRPKLARRSSITPDTLNLTRADFAGLAVNYLKLKSNQPVIFEDLPAEDSRYITCATAVSSGFLEILPDRKFYPHYRITRRNMALALFRYAQRLQIKTDSLPGIVPVWKDLSKHDPHYPILLKAWQYEWIKTKNDSLYGADEPLTIDEAVRGFEHFIRLTK